MKQIAILISVLLLSGLANAADNGTYDCTLTTPDSPHDTNVSLTLFTDHALFYEQGSSEADPLTWDPNNLGAWIKLEEVGEGWTGKYKVERNQSTFKTTFEIRSDYDSEPYIQVVTGELTKKNQNNTYSFEHVEYVKNSDGSLVETDKVTYTCSKK